MYIVASIVRVVCICNYIITKLSFNFLNYRYHSDIFELRHQRHQKGTIVESRNYVIMLMLNIVGLV